METIGVVSALADAEEISEIISAFRLSRIIVTGLDMARRFGALAAAVTQGARLVHVTRSPEADAKLETLSARRTRRDAFALTRFHRDAAAILTQSAGALRLTFFIKKFVIPGIAWRTPKADLQLLEKTAPVPADAVFLSHPWRAPRKNRNP